MCCEIGSRVKHLVERGGAVCPKFVRDAAQILDEILRDNHQ